MLSIITFFIGAIAGFFLSALLSAAARADHFSENNYPPPESEK